MSSDVNILDKAIFDESMRQAKKREEEIEKIIVEAVEKHNWVHLYIFKKSDYETGINVEIEYAKFVCPDCGENKEVEIK